jgi:glutathione synthase/RimK-type ligase-like ATP-grasp enzyme
MAKIGFVTCSDLSRFKVSAKNNLLTHDDQLAYDYLQEHNFSVEALRWGTPASSIRAQAYDLLVIRSPWDYSHVDNINKFFSWLKSLHQNNIACANSYELINWNLDKKYLLDLKSCDINILPTVLLSPQDNIEKIDDFLATWKHIVIKPCISAGARDTYLLQNSAEIKDFLKIFKNIRSDRNFMMQPFVDEIRREGEWSLIFINHEYSHAVLKKPQLGHWLVQDELGGSVSCLEPPEVVKNYGAHIFKQLLKFAHDNLNTNYILYGRVDILPGLYLGELELFEPELFFLNRALNIPNNNALAKFHAGITKLIQDL